MRSVLTKVKKVVSYIIIILSFITGIAATATAEWDDLFINIFLYLGAAERITCRKSFEKSTVEFVL
ncbi:hypothetical protein B4065_1357 [Caldibacillus thermoamylovorans]|uniref:hypothetical protein n=1 Tax=Caldibacillus thermoamylovorans TaxID=35841 RepID=UPI0005A4AC08|nr:hypothetical protein [Caldibacillus thermoamylovorans]KIO68798.1 hypothetical protein B4065_1357 [Caldibacillus thermoamylovorans]